MTRPAESGVGQRLHAGENRTNRSKFAVGPWVTIFTFSPTADPVRRRCYVDPATAIMGFLYR